VAGAGDEAGAAARRLGRQEHATLSVRHDPHHPGHPQQLGVRDAFHGQAVHQRVPPRHERQHAATSVRHLLGGYPPDVLFDLGVAAVSSLTSTVIGAAGGSNLYNSTAVLSDGTTINFRNTLGEIHQVGTTLL
jgi:hypothetical protein